MTRQQAVQKLATLCSQAEYCEHDMREKMSRWELSADDKEAVVAYLVKERYIDEERFCRYFVNDKMRFNKWGRRKIEQALYAKHIPSEVSEPVLNAIADEEWVDILRPLLRQKERSTTGRTEYERTTKLVRFALSRGFTYDIIRKVIAAEIDDMEAME